MRRETISCLAEIVAAATRINQALIGVSLSQFASNWEKQSAVERQLLVIGEALVRIRDMDSEVFGQIPDGNKIIGLRNLLAHGYDAVDSSAIYLLCDQPLRDLRKTAESLLPT
ncbi:MAG: DUF86 domain-containing protein [Armatimonadetes bacterium]|nr:DUF86 domain-containing protein [Armatimonadota bacterium]